MVTWWHQTLSPGDIAHRASHDQWLAVSIARDYRAAGQYPFPWSIPGTDAEFAHVVRHGADEASLQATVHPASIVRVKESAFAYTFWNRPMEWARKERSHAAGKFILVVYNVPVPNFLACAFQREVQAFAGDSAPVLPVIQFCPVKHPADAKAGCLPLTSTWQFQISLTLI